jgi:3-deoxy-D-manno-octulosonic-acid transferase
VLGGLGAEMAERLGSVPSQVQGRLAGRRKVWWVHAASAGEVSGLEPFLDEVAARPDAPLVVLTTTTAAGREAARRLRSVSHACLAPVDIYPCVRRFIRALKPERLLLTETELWPSTIIQGSRAGLKPVLINARMTGRSRTRYGLIKPLLRPALESLHLVCAQTQPDADRFTALGARNVVVAGNTKYDKGAAASTMTEEARIQFRLLGLEGKRLFVAGSTHPVEEDAVLAAFLQARSLGAELTLVLAPRHAERAHEALKALKDAGLKPALWSKGFAPGSDCVLVDVMGVLPSLWPHAAAGFVGGTLVKVGGHNLLEPALAGCPVLFGPHTWTLEHVAVILENGGGGWRVRDARELADRLAELARDPERAKGVGGAARRLAEGLRGATRRCLTALGERGA